LPERLVSEIAHYASSGMVNFTYSLFVMYLQHEPSDDHVPTVIMGSELVH